MYLASVRKPSTSGQGATPLRAVLTGNVLALGMVSLLTDISTEMVGGIIGAYLVFGLGLTTVGVGAVDGFYQGATAVTRLAGGYLADRFGARKVVAGLGYGLGVVAKFGLIFLPSVAGVTGSLGLDRIGKGIRTSPRDALSSA
jgi:nitrate/nitrite transporter NarK